VNAFQQFSFIVIYFQILCCFTFVIVCLLCSAFTFYPELYWLRLPRIAFLPRSEIGVLSKKSACDQVIIYFSNGLQNYSFFWCWGWQTGTV